MLEVKSGSDTTCKIQLVSPTRVGSRIATDYISDWIEDSGELFELELMEEATAKKVVERRDGGYAIDVGANIGCWTLYLSRFFSHIISVEPQTILADCLKQSLIMNAINNVTIVNKALSNLPSGTKITFQAPFMSSNRCRPVINYGGSCEDGYRGTPVQVESCQLTDINLPSGVCHLIKIDVEGSEPEVIDQLLPIIVKDRPTLLVEQHGVANIKETLDKIPGYVLKHQLISAGNPLSVYIHQ